MPARIFTIIGLFLTPAIAFADTPAKKRLDAHGFPLPDGAIARLGDLRFAQPPKLRFTGNDKLQTHTSDTQYLWNLSTRKLISKRELYPLPSDGRTPSDTGDSGRLFVRFVDGGFAVRDNVTGRTLCRLPGVKSSGDWSMLPRFCDDGSRVLVASKIEDAILVRWFNSRSGREKGRFQIPKSEYDPYPIVGPDWYARDGSVFGYVAAENRLKLIDCRTRELFREIDAPGLTPRKDAKDSPYSQWRFHTAIDDAYLVAWRSVSLGAKMGSWECAIWDNSNGDRLRHFCFRPVVDHQWHAELSPDGRTLAVRKTGDSRVTFYETLTGRRQGDIRARNAIHDFCYAPDGKTFATSGADTSILLWNANQSLTKRPSLTFEAPISDREYIWELLATLDGEEANRAIWAMVGSPDDAVKWMAKRMQPVREIKVPAVPPLIAALGGRNFKQRQIAARKLVQLGDLAYPALRELLKTGNLEQVRRAKQIIQQQIDNPVNPPSCLREIRAIQVLERIGSVDAKLLLRRLAGGTVDSLVTREARLALRRMQGTR